MRIYYAPNYFFPRLMRLTCCRNRSVRLPIGSACVRSSAFCYAQSFCRWQPRPGNTRGRGSSAKIWLPRNTRWASASSRSGSWSLCLWHHCVDLCNHCSFALPEIEGFFLYQSLNVKDTWFLTWIGSTSLVENIPPAVKLSKMVSAVINSHRYLDIKEYFPSETIQLAVEWSIFKELSFITF